MSRTPFARWGRNSRLYAQYTANAARRLQSDETVQAAKAEWETFLVQSHGDIFSGIDGENPRETLFVDTLYYDFVVDQLVEFAEREFGFRLVNQEPHVNTAALSVDFQGLHETILDDETARERVHSQLDRATFRDAAAGSLRDLYESIVSREVRLALGEYYTPRGVAELGVAELEVESMRDATFLDPGCGSGVFVAACVDAKLDALAGDDPEAALETVVETVYGIDLNPVAVKSTKLSYVLSLLPVLERADAPVIELPVFLTDALGLTRDDTLTFRGEPFAPTVDHLVGNPPWITWNNLSESVKQAWRETYVDQLELLPHGGIESRLGHGNDDISVMFVWVCIRQYLREGGSASFVLKRDITKGPAGKLLRTQRVDGRPVSVERIHDFNHLRPFGDGVGVAAAIYTMVADTPPSFPIPTTSWTRGETVPEYESVDSMRDSLRADTTGVVPVAADEPASPWVREDAERRALGECAHDIRHGLKDDATAVYTIDRSELAELEPDLVYPYLKSRHVVKYGLFGHDLHLVPMRKANEDNEAVVRERFPKTYAYLERHRDRLEARASSWFEQGTFYNVFGLGAYTWSEYKVVWCRLGFKPHFAVVSTVDDPDLGEKMVVPGDHFMFISTASKQEAHFLCALLNSAVYQRSIRGVASEGKASLSKAVVSRLALPEYSETAESERLAELSMQAHDIVPEYTDVSKRAYNRRTIDELAVVQAEIDEIVAEVVADGSGLPDAGQRSPTSF